MAAIRKPDKPRPVTSGDWQPPQFWLTDRYLEATAAGMPSNERRRRLSQLLALQRGEPMDLPRDAYVRDADGQGWEDDD